MVLNLKNYYVPHYKGAVWDVDLLADNGNIINIATRVDNKNPYGQQYWS